MAGSAEAKVYEAAKKQAAPKGQTFVGVNKDGSARFTDIGSFSAQKFEAAQNGFILDDN
jgi:hypothetical protein